MEVLPPLSRNMRRWGKILLVAGGIVCALYLAGRIVAWQVMERIMLTTGPNGPETPASLGVPFEWIAIPSGTRGLDSYVVTASSTCEDPPVVVIYHGIQETISEWVQGQRFLYNHCVSSVVFDYTGSGNSSRPARFEAVGQDSISAYEFTRSHFPGRRVYVLGHSMGNGPMLEAVPHFSSSPAGVIVANAFISLRSIGRNRKTYFYRLLTYTIPDWWNNLKAAPKLNAPILVIHSDTDRVNSVEDGRNVFAAAPQPKTLVILHGYNHNALYQHPSEEWWAGVLAFMSARPPRPTNSHQQR
jgi:alpha-beta hydrolase superfamily lysophospholipase